MLLALGIALGSGRTLGIALGSGRTLGIALGLGRTLGLALGSGRTILVAAVEEDAFASTWSPCMFAAVTLRRQYAQNDADKTMRSANERFCYGELGPKGSLPD